MFPDRLILQAFLARGLVTWVLVRSLVSAVVLLGRGDPLRMTFVSLVILVVVSAGAGYLHSLRNHEFALLGNLGIGTPMLLGMLAIPTIAAELFLALFR